MAAVVLSNLACAVRLRLDNRDLCGLQGMELRGVSISTTRAYAAHSRGGGSLISGSGRQVSCEVPPEDNERVCKVQAYRARAVFKRRHHAYTNDGRQELAKQASVEWQNAYQECAAGAAGEATPDDEQP